MKLRYCISVAAVILAGIVLARTFAQASPQASAKIKEAAAKPTPRLADGHPNLSGAWIGVGQGEDTAAHQGANGTIFIDVPPDKGGPKPDVDRTPDEQFVKVPDKNPPPYNPELLAKVNQLGTDKVKYDPNYGCNPPGVPRAGAPAQIVETPGLAVFLYVGEYGQSARLIPTDGRQHRTDVDPSYFGDSIGHWEGDTLVIDVTHISENTWLANGTGGQQGSGYFHSDALHVVERLTRKGDTLRWEATVEDPEVLTKPWSPNPQTRILSDENVYEKPPCFERETPHMVNKY